MKDAQNLFHFIEKLIQPTIEKKGIHLIKLLEDWQLIMSSEVKTITKPYKIVWKANNQGVLYVKSNNVIINNILLYKKQDFIDKINSYFGYNCIVEIKFIV